MPLVRRLPKVGFSNERHEESFFEVSIKTLAYAYKEGGRSFNGIASKKKGLLTVKRLKKLKF